MGKRPYRQRKRAESQEETRRRIVEATMQLHEELGPRGTTISAIAERAGVQRLTVYRHFPDDTAVFQACTAHWLRLHPIPDPAGWAGIEAPAPRLRRALEHLHRYYGETERMWRVSYRDEADVPALREPMAQVRAFMRSIGDTLAAGFACPPSRRDALTATVHHALSFATWTSLRDEGLAPQALIDMLLCWVAAVQDGVPGPHAAMGGGSGTGQVC